MPDKIKKILRLYKREQIDEDQVIWKLNELYEK